MKSIATILLLSYGALAASISNPSEQGAPHMLFARSLAVVETALYNISNKTTDLGKLISQFSVSEITELQTATAATVEAIEVGNANVKASSPLSVQDAVALIPIIKQLAHTVNVTVQDTIDQRVQFAGLQPVVLANLQQQQQLTVEFSATVSSKLPASLRNSSAQLTEPVFESLALGVKALQNMTTNNVTELEQNSAMFTRPSWLATGVPVVMLGLAALSMGAL